jgi:tryptophanyl-tRNA synthetase
MISRVASITGLQPTGDIHLGNYFGAIRPFVDGIKDGEQHAIFIADYHAITAKFSPDTLRANTKNLYALLLACGAANAMVFQQSAVPAHTELAWILQATAARFGWLNRMIQFKEKMEDLGANSEGPSVGLFTYPVLQAADILLYGAERVPVGEDQQQHLNLTVDIAEKFNREFGETFVVPKPMVTGTGGRVMSLYDGRKKMSKSDPDDMTRINLLDDASLIAKKIKRATSDSGFIPDDIAEIADRPELRNLLTLYGLVTRQTPAEALAVFSGQGYGKLKPALTDAVVAFLEPIQARHKEYAKGEYEVEEYRIRDETRANRFARETLKRVKYRIGL